MLLYNYSSIHIYFTVKGVLLIKVAFFGDLHLGNFKEFSKQVSVYWDTTTQRYESWTDEVTQSQINLNSRLVNTVNALADIRDRLVEDNIINILFCGDLFHHRNQLDTYVINSAINIFRSFKEKGLNIYAIAGNHDQVDNSIFGINSLAILSPYMEVYSSPQLITITNGKETETVAMIPYCKEKAQIMQFLSTVPEKSIIVAHLGVNGALNASGTLQGDYGIDDLTPSKFKLIALGHFHRPQLFTKNMFYVGATVQQSFSDEIPSNELNGFYVWDTKKITKKVYESNTPRFITSYDVTTVPKETKDFYRVRTQFTKDSIKKAETLDNLSNVRIEYSKEYTSNVSSEISISSSVLDAIRIYSEENHIPYEIGEFIFHNKNLDPQLVQDTLSTLTNGGEEE